MNTAAKNSARRKKREWPFSRRSLDENEWRWAGLRAPQSGVPTRLVKGNRRISTSFVALVAQVSGDAVDELNQIAPNTAVGFLLVGVALGSQELGPKLRRFIGPPAALTTLLIGLIAFLGYAYSIHSLYAVGMHLPMALPTAIGLVLTAFGVLVQQQPATLRRLIESERVGSAMARKLVPAAILDGDHFKQINDTHGHVVGDEVPTRTPGFRRTHKKTARPVKGERSDESGMRTLSARRASSCR